MVQWVEECRATDQAGSFKACIMTSWLRMRTLLLLPEALWHGDAASHRRLTIGLIQRLHPSRAITWHLCSLSLHVLQTIRCQPWALLVSGQERYNLQLPTLRGASQAPLASLSVRTCTATTSKNWTSLSSIPKTRRPTRIWMPLPRVAGLACLRSTRARLYATRIISMALTHPSQSHRPAINITLVWLLHLHHRVLRCTLLHSLQMTMGTTPSSAKDTATNTATTSPNVLCPLPWLPHLVLPVLD